MRLLVGLLLGSAVFATLAHASRVETVCTPVVVAPPSPCRSAMEEAAANNGVVPDRCRIA